MSTVLYCSQATLCTPHSTLLLSSYIISITPSPPPLPLQPFNPSPSLVMSLTVSTVKPLSFPVILCVLFLCLSSFTSAQTLNIADLSIASITSRGSCQDAYPYAWNCTLPSSLTFTLTTAVLSPPSYLFFLIDGANAETYTYASRVANSNSSWVGTVALGGYAVGLMGRPLSVTVFDPTSNARSQPFVGLSFALKPPPFFTSISGCQGSGKATYLCVPGNDTLTLQGSGFSLFLALRSYLMVVGNSTLPMGPQTGSTANLQVVNDSYALVALSDVYGQLPPSLYGGAVYPISFNLEWRQLSTSALAYYYTNSLSLSFAPLPPPQPSVTSSTACTILNSTALINCLPGANAGIVAMTGHYLATATVTLSAPGLSTWPASTLTTTSVRLPFILPLIPEDTAGQAWDVTVTSSAGSVVFPGLITFSTAPYVALISTCSDTGSTSSLTPNCMAGSTISLSGDHFLNDPLMQVQITSTSAMTAGVNISCPSATFVSSNLITCVIPTLNDTLAQLFFGARTVLRVLFPSTGQVTNAYNSRLMAWSISPILTKVSGCEGNNGSLSLVRCRGGDVITVYGSNLSFYNARGVIPNTAFGVDQNPPFGFGSCSILPGGTSAEVQCRLSYVDATNSAIQEGVQYSVQWYGNTDGYGGILFGNAFYISFTWDPLATATPTPDTSSSSNTMAIFVGVLVPVLAVVLGVTAWVMWRKRQCIKDSCPRSSTATAEEKWDGERGSSSPSTFFGSLNPQAQYESGGVELH